MSHEVEQQFFSADTAARLHMIRDAQAAPILRQALGTAAFADYEGLVARLDTSSHLSLAHPVNLIFVPGVMGSLLHSETKGGIWWLDMRALHHLDGLRLAPDGLHDADATNRIAPFSLDVSYEAFLTAVLERDDFGHRYFAYDWRKPLRASAAALRDLIVSTYANNGGTPVHLVGHSMGGLMIRTALRLYGAELWPLLGRIVFVGTPHYGAPAIASYLKNHLWGFEELALLGWHFSRETFRSMWGVLSLLPAPVGIYPNTRAGETWSDAGEYQHPGLNFDPYQVSDYKLELSVSEITALTDVLADAAEFHRQLYDFHHGLDQTLRDRMLVIAGVGQQTLFRLTRTSLLFLWEQTRKETTRSTGDPHREGDGRVALASAQLEYVPIRYVKGVHGGLTNIPTVYEDIFRWLNEEQLQLPDTPAGALSQHLADAATETSVTPHLDGTSQAFGTGDDAGLWHTEEFTPTRRQALQQALDAGQLPSFARVRIL